jgi:hypothetical protein
MRSAFALTMLTLMLAACAAGGPPELPPVGGSQIEITPDSVQVLVLESFPMQVKMQVKGHLPTPCHELRWEVGDPDEERQIHVDLWAELGSETTCAQVLEPFEDTIDLGNFEERGYSIWINGEKAGEF